MASIYKRGGRKNRHGKYRISYFDERGRRLDHSSGTSDYDAAYQIAKKLEAEVALRARGVISPEVTSQAAHGTRPIDEHVAEYISSCEFEQQSPVHVKNKRTQLKKLLGALRATRLLDLEANGAQRHLQDLRASGKSARTVNQHRNTAVAFCAWCVSSGRMASNPLQHLPRLNEALDRRRVARPFTLEELRALVGRSGRRAPFYVVWAHTGLRMGTLKQLRWSDVDLERGRLMVRAGINKSRRDKLKPLHAEALEILRLLRSQQPDGKALVFQRVPTHRTFNRDLERAGIARVDAAGRRVYRHANRHTLGTWLALRGVPAAITQQVMDHSSISTTMRHYGRVELQDQADVIGSFPRLLISHDRGGAQQNRQQLCGREGQHASAPGQIDALEASSVEVGAEVLPASEVAYNREIVIPWPRLAADDTSATADKFAERNLRAIGAAG